MSKVMESEERISNKRAGPTIPASVTSVVPRSNDPMQGIAVPLAKPLVIPAIYNAETTGRSQEPSTKKRSILNPVYGK